MELAHRFTVPTPVEETWEHFNDIASMAECFPGATVTSAEGDTFQGSCKVKLGPIALVYNGSGTFVEKDEAAHRFVVDAKGKDKRGNGTAGATVKVAMNDASGSTDVEVLTDLAITGKPAQFGRGVMQDVSDKLLGQFVSCLETRLAGGGAEPAGESSQETAAAADDPRSPEVAPPDPQAEPTPVSPGPVSEVPPEPAQPPSAVAEPAPAAPPPKQDDAINLGSTVLPILIRTYWWAAVIVLALVVLVIWLVAS